MIIAALSPLLAGFGLGASLIIAIGAQNAFILRQGLLRTNVFILCLICAVSDAALIALGVGGFGTLIQSMPRLIVIVTIGGALFLFIYGALAFKRALEPQTMTAANGQSSTLKSAIATCLALTFLNPHVYLDTVILLGGISSQYVGNDRIFFAFGAMLASFVWFFSLGYGARALIKVFEQSLAWRILDILIGIVMWMIAATFASGLF